MNMPVGTRLERGFIEGILRELSAGRTQFSRDDVKALMLCYRRERQRFNALAIGIAYHLHQDDEHLDTMYGEYTKHAPPDDADADADGMRVQIDRDDDYRGKEIDE